MNIDEAFEQLLKKKNAAKTLGINKSTFSSYKYSLVTGRAIVTLDKKVELLERAGYKVIIEVLEPPRLSATPQEGNLAD